MRVGRSFGAYAAALLFLLGAAPSARAQTSWPQEITLSPFHLARELVAF